MSRFFTMIATVLLFTSALTVQAAEDRDLVESFYTQLLSGTTKADLPECVNEILAPDWQSLGDYSSAPKTREQFLAELQGIGSALPNLTWKVEEILPVGGNRFVVRGRATATPVKPFLGVEPNKRSFEIMSIDIHTVENHKITKSFHVEDWLGATGQLKRK